MTAASRRARLNCLGGALALGLAGAASTDGADYRAAESGGAATTTPAQDGAEGLIPKRLVWPGVAVIVVLAVIATAALTGPIIRANTDEDDDHSGSAPSE
jgi:hypothetical protein